MNLGRKPPETPDWQVRTIVIVGILLLLVHSVAGVWQIAEWVVILCR